MHDSSGQATAEDPAHLVRYKKTLDPSAVAPAIAQQNGSSPLWRHGLDEPSSWARMIFTTVLSDAISMMTIALLQRRRFL